MTEPRDTDLSEADQDAYVQWAMDGAEGMSTLDLRAAQHAAERSGMKEDAERLSRIVGDREARDGAS